MQLYRYSDGNLANTTALNYTICAYILSMYTLSVGNLWFFLFSIILLAHGMVISAYLVHEFIHNSFFKDPKLNRIFGIIGVWILGCGYLPYDLLREKHLRHHVERKDVLAIDYRSWLAHHPTFFLLIQTLQKIHFPAVEWLTHILGMISPFLIHSRKHHRLRTIMVFISRIIFFGLLYALSPFLLLGWFIAYTICIGVLGFMDAYQHTYEITLELDQSPEKPKYDREYEEENTFSNIHNRIHPALNLITLNFSYHNIHHWKSGEPWYRLPALHQKRYKNKCTQEIPFIEQLNNFFKYRTTRISNTAQDAITDKELGAAGVSFLVCI